MEFGIGKVFGQESTEVKWNYQILGLHPVTVHQKLGVILILLMFIYFEKATIFCEIITIDLSYVVLVKSRVEILQNFVAFSKYMNFIGMSHDQHLNLVLFFQKNLTVEVSEPCKKIVQIWMSTNKKTVCVLKFGLIVYNKILI